jgi:hypothetical protein
MPKSHPRIIVELEEGRHLGAAPGRNVMHAAARGHRAALFGEGILKQHEFHGRKALGHYT